MTGDRDLKIDALRGLAAISVLLLHTQNAWYLGVGSDLPPEQRLRLLDHWLGVASIPVTLGWLGVNLFFVLSGLCIHSWYLNEQERMREFSYSSYLRRRFWRLYPAYVATVAFSLLCLALAEFIRLRAAGAGDLSFWANNVVEQTVRYLTFTHTLKRDTIAGYNPPLYTMATEVHFYLLYPLALWSFRRIGAWKTFLLSAAAATILLASAYQTQLVDIVRPVEESALVRWPEWLIGCVIAEYWFQLRSGAARKPPLHLLLPAALALLALALYVQLRHRLVLNLVWTLAMAALVAAYLSPAIPGTSTLERRLAAVGLFSYSLYLIHWPILRIAALLLGASAATLGWNLLAYAFVIAAIIMVARFFFEHFEKPFLSAPAR